MESPDESSSEVPILLLKTKPPLTNPTDLFEETEKQNHGDALRPTTVPLSERLSKTPARILKETSAESKAGNFLHG